MPCIKIIDSIKIYIYLRDHNQPHFHALYAGYEELIEIKNLENYSGKLPKVQKKKVMNWAKQNKSYLLRKWKEFNPDK